MRARVLKVGVLVYNIGEREGGREGGREGREGREGGEGGW